MTLKQTCMDAAGELPAEERRTGERRTPRFTAEDEAQLLEVIATGPDAIMAYLRTRHEARYISAMRREFPVNILGGPMREYAPGKWENAIWPSEDQHLAALGEWFAKTDWVQEQQDSFSFNTLGMHRADVLRREIEHLRAATLTEDEIVAAAGRWNLGNKIIGAYETPARGQIFANGMRHALALLKEKK